MNKSKILFLLFLFVAVGSITLMNTVDAATYKTNIKFKDYNGAVTKYIAGDDYLTAFYWSKNPKGWGKKMQLSIMTSEALETLQTIK